MHFPKIARPSLSNRRVHSRTGLLQIFVSQPLRLLHVPTLWFCTTSPVYSSSILSALLQRLATIGFIVVSLALSNRGSILQDSRDALSALRSFPSADSCCAPDIAEASCDARCPCGEALTSCPTVTPRNVYTLRKFTSRLTASSFTRRGKLPSRFKREPRGFSPSSGPLCSRRFQLLYPVLPWAWAPPACARRSQYVKDRFLRTRLSALTVRLSPVSWGT